MTAVRPLTKLTRRLLALAAFAFGVTLFTAAPVAANPPVPGIREALPDSGIADNSAIALLYDISIDPVCTADLSPGVDVSVTNNSNEDVVVMLDGPNSAGYAHSDAGETDEFFLGDGQWEDSDVTLTARKMKVMQDLNGVKQLVPEQVLVTETFHANCKYVELGDPIVQTSCDLGGGLWELSNEGTVETTYTIEFAGALHATIQAPPSQPVEGSWPLAEDEAGLFQIREGGELRYSESVGLDCLGASTTGNDDLAGAGGESPVIESTASESTASEPSADPAASLAELAVTTTEPARRAHAESATAASAGAGPDQLASGQLPEDDGESSSLGLWMVVIVATALITVGLTKLVAVRRR